MAPQFRTKTPTKSRSLTPKHLRGSVVLPSGLQMEVLPISTWRRISGGHSSPVDTCRSGVPPTSATSSRGITSLCLRLPDVLMSPRLSLTKRPVKMTWEYPEVGVVQTGGSRDSGLRVQCNRCACGELSVKMDLAALGSEVDDKRSFLYGRNLKIETLH